MLERWMPYSAADFNPVFRFGVRRLRFARSAQTLSRRSLLLTLVFCAIILALWALMLVGEYRSRSCANFGSSYCYYSLVSASSSFAAALALFSIGVDVFLDFACVLAGYNTLRMDSEAVHWDLLRLTPMRIEALVEANYGVAQARAWLMTVWVTTLRVASIGLFLITAFVLPVVLRGTFGDVGLGFDANLLFTVTALILIAAIFMIEPLWRMRAMTALGLALASRFRQPTMGALAALGSILAVWLVQGFIFGLMLYATFLVGRYSAYTLSPPFGAVMGALVIWFFYRRLTAFGLRRAIREVTPR